MLNLAQLLVQGQQKKKKGKAVYFVEVLKWELTVFLYRSTYKCFMDQEGYPHMWLNTTGWHLQLQQLMVVVVEGGGGWGVGGVSLSLI